MAHEKNAGRAGTVVDEGGGGSPPSPTWPGSWPVPVSRHREQATESSLEAGKVDRCML